MVLFDDCSQRFLIDWLKQIAWFNIWLFLIWLASNKSLAKNDGFWHPKFSLNISLFLSSSFLILLTKSWILVVVGWGVVSGVA